jgi:hypothetical protein
MIRDINYREWNVVVLILGDYAGSLSLLVLSTSIFLATIFQDINL